MQTAGSGATSVSFTFDNITTGKIYTTDLSAPSGTSLHGNSAEFIVETPEVTIGHQQSQPLLSNFLGSPVVFQDASAIYQGQSAPIALSSAQTMGLWTNDVPGSLGRYVQEAYGSVQGDTITVTENDYWPDTPSFGVALLGSASTNQGLWELS